MDAERRPRLFDLVLFVALMVVVMATSVASLWYYGAGLFGSLMTR